MALRCYLIVVGKDQMEKYGEDGYDDGGVRTVLLWLLSGRNKNVVQKAKGEALV